MDKNILHSVLETLTVGQEISITFNQPFAAMTGDYIVTQSKTGRGRGGSRVIEIKSAADPTVIHSTLNIDGKDKAIGTGTSEYIASMAVNGTTYNTEQTVEKSARKPRTKDSDAVSEPMPPTEKKDRSTLVSEKVANALGKCLQENPQTIFKLKGMEPNSNLTGEWRVASFTYENSILHMECVDVDNPERTMSFDSTVDGIRLKDAEVVMPN